MPLVYIHGVRQRNRAGLERLKLRFVELMRALSPRIAGVDEAFEVRVPYWGDLASRSDYESILPATLAHARSAHGLPALSEVLGTRDALPEDLLASAGTLLDVPYGPARGGEEAPARAGGVDLAPLLQAAATRPNTVEGMIRSLANDELSNDERDQLDDLLAEGWHKVYERMLQADAAASATQASYDQESAARDAAGQELPWPNTRALSNFRGAVERAATLAALGMPAIRGWVDAVHRDFAMFTGDAIRFVIDCEREGRDGKICSRLLAELEKPGSGPLIVITHSMGAAVFYSLWSRFCRDLQVDCLISVGSQIAQFQNLGLFPEQARDDKGRVTGLKPGIKCWYNAYDKLDFLNFVASPVFADAIDVPFSNRKGPLEAHAAYWSDPNFYELLSELLLRALAK